MSTRSRDAGAASEEAPDSAAADAAAEAAERVVDETAKAATPEQIVVSEPPPRPDYPRYRVTPDDPIVLAELDPDESEEYASKRQVRDELREQRKRISDLQGRLYAEHRRSLLIVLQAIDTGGKDGTIKGVFQGVNPQGCQVFSFKAPSAEELDHHWLWRYDQHTPQRGMITIFNRSHYEDVLIVRVKKLVPEEQWRRRYETINQFERMLTINGITVLKFLLHISRDEQKHRLQARLDDPAKRWKFSSADIVERALWDEYQLAFQDAINSCSTPHAPWYVVPANRKWYRNLVVARTIADTLEAMDPRYPPAETGLDSVVIPD